MKKIVVLLGVFFLAITAQSQWEPAAFAGIGYMTDNSGHGIYVYAQAGAAKKKNSHRFGAFISNVIVDVNFNNYRYQAQEYGLGFSYDTWKQVSENYFFVMWFNPQIKYFDDHGQNFGNSEEAFQQDIGSNIVLGFNFNDGLNRWFRSYKFQTQYQQPLWSRRQGTQTNEDGYLSDRVNFKAVNKTYWKSQFEVTVKKISVSPLIRIEPKFVIAYQLNGLGEIMYETGTGLALSFMKGDRYFEVSSLQYRARVGQTVTERLDLIELNVDVINILRLMRE
jgi:hypothetical protein